MPKEAHARIKINKLLEESGWRFFDNENGINANKQLIQIFEQKIKDEINKLWQSEVSDTSKVSDNYTTDASLSLVAEE